MAASRTISIRLSLDQAVETKAALESLGTTGGAALDKLSAGISKLGATDASGVVQALERITSAATRAQAATAQAQANSFAGVQAPDDSAAYGARNKAIQDYGNQMDNLRAKFVPLFATSKAYESTLTEIGRAEKVGAISAAEAAAAREHLTASFAASNAPIAAAGAAAAQHGKVLDGVTVSSGAAAAATRNLSIQVIQGISGIATGQPVLTTLIQQGHQVVDSSLAMGTGFKGLGDAAKGMFNAVGGLPTLLGVATVGALVALGAAAESEGRRLSDLRQQLRATHDGYADLADSVDAAAKRVAATTTLSTAQAREAAQTIASAKYFSGTSTDIERLAAMSADLARIWNTDVAKASGVLRDAINDPAAAAKTFAEQGLPGFTQALARTVEGLQTSGKSGVALQLVLDQLSASSKGAAKDQTPLQKALHDLEAQFYGTKDGTKSLAVEMGEFVDKAAAGAIGVLTRLIDALNRARRASNVEGMDKFYGTAPDTPPAYPLFPGASTSGSAPTLGSLPTVIQPLIAAAAAQTKVDAELLARLQKSENAPDRNGNYPTSSAGAVGPFQIKPGTFNGIPGFAGKDINDVPTNVNAGATLFARLLQKYGNPEDAIYAYHDGEPAMDAILAGIRKPSNDAQVQAERVLNGYSGDGRYRAAAATPPAATTPQVANGDQLSPPTSGTLQDTNRKAVDDADKLADAARVLSDLRRKLIEQRDGLAASLAIPGQTPEQYQKLNEALAKTNGELNDAISPAEKMIRSFQDQAASASAVTAGDKALLDIRQRIAEEERSTGTTFTSEQKAKLEALAIGQLSASLKALTFDLGRQTSDQAALAAAYGQGNQAVLDTTAKQQAYQTLLQKFPQDSAAIAAALPDLAAKYEALSRSQAVTATAQQNSRAQDNLALIQAETDSLGMNDTARNRLIATMKAEQEMHRQFGDILPPQAEQYIRLASATSDASAKLAAQQQTLSDLTGAVTSASDAITNGITQSFLSGQGAAVNWGNILQGIESQVIGLIAKLAILNPLLEAIDGTKRSNLTTVGGLLGNLLGNSTGTTVSTDAAATNSAIAALGVGVYGPATPDSVASAKAGASGTSGGSLTDIASSVASLVSKVGGGTGSTIAGLGATTAYSSTSGLAGPTVSGATLDSAQGAVASGGIGVTIAQGAALIGGLYSAYSGFQKGGVGGTLQAGAGIAGAGLAAAGTGLLGAGAYSASLALGPYAPIAIAAIAVLSAFLPGAHPKNPYQNTEVDIQNGQIVAGKQVSQLESTQPAVDSINTFNGQLQTYMEKVGIVITNGDTKLGDIGEKIKGMQQNGDITELFNRLHFGNVPGDTSNFGIAKSALGGMTFDTVEGLNNELVKIAAFSDSMSALGIQLGQVGTDLTNIQVASVSLTGALDEASTASSDAASATAAAANDNADGAADAVNQLRIALDHDLRGQVFANVDALSAEIDKVNQFVNGTMQGLLHPVLVSTSAFIDALAASHKKYDDAIAEAVKYGLDYKPLERAKDAADALLYYPQRVALDQANDTVTNNITLAGGADPTAKFYAQAGNDNIAHDQQRDALIKSMTDVYGDATKSTQFYFDRLANLDALYAAQVATSVAAFQRQQTTNGLTIQAAYMSIQARQAVLGGNQEQADLLTYDAKAAQERDSYANQLADFYGENFRQSQDYQNRLSELETVQQGERLAIIKKYGADATSTLAQAQGNVTSLFTSLTTYAQKLQTGADSPLSATDQYALASRQFSAVAGAAAAGDYNSASQITTYADSLLSTSRAVNGSGAGYASDFSKVLDALSSVSAASDALTASAQRQIQQDQTAKLQASIEDMRDTLDASLTAVRREIQQQTRQQAA